MKQVRSRDLVWVAERMAKVELANLELQLLTAQHIEGALQLCRLAGWNQTAYDWQRLLRLEPEGCFAICSDSQVLGTVTTTRYGNVLAWIGMMLVHPDYRRRGLATRLIEKSLDYLRAKGSLCIKLDATPTGRMVYEKLGFEVEWTFQRRVLEQGSRSLAANGLLKLEGEDSAWPARSEGCQPGTFSAAVLELDERAFGADRSGLIQDMAPGTSSLIASDAYGLRRPGYLADYLGPVVAESLGEAQKIIHELVRRTPRNIFWDVPTPNDSAIRLADALGFRPTRDLIRMQINVQQPSPQYEKQYAMFDPSVG